MRDKKSKIVSSIVLIVLLLGTYIYYIGINSNNGFDKLLRSIYLSGAMFCFNNDFDNIKASLQQNYTYLICFWGIHILSVSSTVIIFISVINKNFRRNIKLLRANWVKRYIIWGVNTQSIVFIKNLLKDSSCGRKEVILVLSTDEKIVLNPIEDLDIIYIYDNIDDKKIYKRLFLHTPFNKETYLLFLDSDYIRNMGMVTRIGQIISNKKKNDLLHIVLNTKLHDIPSFLQENIKCNLNVINNANLMARQFLTNFPTYELIDVDTDKAITISNYTVMIIGFGDTGEQLLLNILAQTQYENTEFNALVIDKNADQLIGKFEREYSGLCKNYSIEFYDYDVNSKCFSHLLCKKLEDINEIVICLASDEQNIRTGFEIKRIVSSYNNIATKIIIKCVKQNLFIQYLKEDTNENANIHFFGDMQDVFTPQIIINQDLDRLAICVNDVYGKSEPKYAKRWEDLNPFIKDSNRHSASHIFAKLHLVGLKTCEVNSIPSSAEVIKSKQQFIEYLGEERLQVLSRLEHLRWNAFHFSNGWDVLPLGQAANYKDTEKKLHTCLVSWDALEDVSNKFNSDYQLKDRQQIEQIVDYLAAINYVVYK